MPIAVLTAKGQMTIPKEIRKALHLKQSERVIIVVEGDQAILKPLRGSLLDIGGSIPIPASERPVAFKKVRDEVRKRLAKRIAEGA